MSVQVSAAALAAGHPEAFDDRPDWLKAVDGDESYAWARTAWAAAAAEPGAWFDHQLADTVVADWPNWATLTLDRFAGIKFRLAQWQEIIVRLLVGWMVPSEILDPETHETVIVHVRLFRRLLLWVQRKNGKSEFLAALALLFFVIDGVTQGEGWVFARKEKQARIVYSRMKAMVANDPEFSAEIVTFSKSLYVKSLAAKFEVLPGALEGNHGFSPSVVVGDEMHEWRSTEIMDTLRQGMVGRLEPMELYASTAGRKSGGHSPGEQLYTESVQIISGVISDPRTLAVIFAVNDDDDPGDEATWAKANPNLGLAPTKDAIRHEYRKTIGNPRALAHFKCYHLGIWSEATSKWLPLRKWDACAASKTGWKQYAETLKGREGYLGFDISSTRDITALVVLFPPTEDDPKWRVFCRFWIPADNVEARVAEGAPVQQFIDAGAMETTPDDYVDQNALGLAIIQACQDFKILGIGYDKWNAAKLYGDLVVGNKIEEGAPALDAGLFQEVRQGIYSLGEASKTFEKLVFAGLLDHGGHPVLRWMAGNVVIHFDRNHNFMPAKDRSTEKIDGISAAVTALAVANLPEEETEYHGLYSQMGAAS